MTQTSYRQFQVDPEQTTTQRSPPHSPISSARSYEDLSRINHIRANLSHSSPYATFPGRSVGTATTTTLSVLNLPLPGSKLAPTKFKGDYSKVKKFLTHYKRLLAQNNVVLDREKCESITQYCSRTVGEFIEALPSYTTPNWEQLNQDLLNFYDADLDTKRFKVKHLLRFVKNARTKRVHSLAAWKQYTREFISIGGWLLAREKINRDEYFTYFWTGIPTTLRSKLENRLLAGNPTRDLSIPFTYREVTGAAEGLLQRDRFDSNVVDTESEDDDESEDDRLFDSEDDTSDTEHESSSKTKKGLKKKKLTKKRRRYTDTDDEDLTSKLDKVSKSTNSKRTVEGTQEEVEKIISKLNTMSVTDPSYAFVYFKAVKLDPDISKVVGAPASQAATYQHARGSSYHPTITPIQRQIPPHLAPNTYIAQPLPPPPPMNRSSNCYGCGKEGHNISACPGLGDYIARGVLTRGPNGRLVFANGAPIRRYNNETLLQTVEREINTVQSHLVTVQDEDYGYYDVSDADDDDDDDNFYDDQYQYGNREESTPEIYQVQGAKHFQGPVEYSVSDLSPVIQLYLDDEDESSDDGLSGVAPSQMYFASYPAKRVEKTTTAARKAVFDGVHVPPVTRSVKKAIDKQRDNEKENRPIIPQAVKSTTKTPAPIKPKASPTGNIEPVAKAPLKGARELSKVPREVREITRGQVPIDTRRPMYNGTNDDEIMEDKTAQQDLAPPQIRKPNQAQQIRTNVDRPEEARVSVPRQSAISAHADKMRVMNAMLSTQVPLAIGEILGTSKELAQFMIDSLKLKPAPKPTVVATSFLTRDRGPLIRLPLTCNGKSIEAIIDTGSQLNIVSDRIFKRKINCPIDTREQISISDANGGKGILKGVASHVPLDCGAVSTEANLWVGDHVPFQMLLGRPWQRDNFVSIDEREDGTYLLFKDLSDMNNRYEIMVTPGGVDNDWNFDPSAWHAPTSFFITTSNEAQSQPYKIGSSLRSGTSSAFGIFRSAPATLSEIMVVINIWIQTLMAIGLLTIQFAGKKGKSIKATTQDDRIFGVSAPSQELMTSPVLPDIAVLDSLKQPTAVVPAMWSERHPRSEAQVLRVARVDADHLRENGKLQKLVISSSAAVELGPYQDV
jgi:hypothetical protein